MSEVKFGLRHGNGCFDNLVKNMKEKIYDEESFDKDCFCNVNETGIYFELYHLQFKNKMNMMKVSSKNIEAGVMELKDS